VPLYEYQCDACSRRFEVIQKFSDPPVETCTECGKGPVHRLFSSPAIQFKGTGWYITDYARKGSSDAATPAAKTDAAKTDAIKTGTSTDTTAKSDTSKGDTSKSDGGSASAPASKE
jgi:putative FmdB family regulatory protein